MTTTMKLMYRGVSYDYQPTVIETTEAEVGGKYRGLDWRFRNLKKAPAQKPTLDLVYRGVAYRTGNANPVVTQPKVTTPVAIPSVRDKARALFWANQQAKLHRQQSMFSRLAERVGLISQHQLV